MIDQEGSMREQTEREDSERRLREKTERFDSEIIRTDG